MSTITAPEDHERHAKLPGPDASGLPPTGLGAADGHVGEGDPAGIIGKAADLLSGPGGLASFLRTRQLGARLAGPSLPLDIAYPETIPPGIRNAVILRDKRCRWAGGCHQPAAACQVHHVKHKAHGGPTSVTDCVPLPRRRHPALHLSRPRPGDLLFWHARGAGG